MCALNVRLEDFAVRITHGGISISKLECSLIQQQFRLIVFSINETKQETGQNK